MAVKVYSKSVVMVKDFLGKLSFAKCHSEECNVTCYNVKKHLFVCPVAYKFLYHVSICDKALVSSYASEGTKKY